MGKCYGELKFFRGLGWANGCLRLGRVLNYGNRFWCEDDSLDFELEVEQVIADGFEDGQSLDFAEVELVFGDFELAADFFLPDDFRREGHVENLLPYFFAGVEKSALQCSLLAAQDEVTAHFLNAHSLFLVESGNFQNMQERHLAAALEGHLADKLNQLSHPFLILPGDGNFKYIFKVLEHQRDSIKCASLS